MTQFCRLAMEQSHQLFLLQVEELLLGQWIQLLLRLEVCLLEANAMFLLHFFLEIDHLICYREMRSKGYSSSTLVSCEFAATILLESDFTLLLLHFFVNQLILFKSCKHETLKLIFPKWQIVVYVRRCHNSVVHGRDGVNVEFSVRATAVTLHVWLWHYGGFLKVVTLNATWEELLL